MPKKVTKKTTKKKTSATKKATRKATAKSKKLHVNKTTVTLHKKRSQAPKTTRSRYCKTVCGPDECVTLCQEKPVTGTAYPCPVCGHGHFCENNSICLSCGSVRGSTFRPYKGE